MKTLGAFALALVFLVAHALFGAPARAGAQPLDEQMLRLDIDRMTPRVVTEHDQTLRVTGSVSNVSDRRISDVIVQLQLGQRQSSERELRGAMAEAPPTDTPITDWIDLAAELEPGQSARIDIAVPLADGTFPVGEPGVHPMLVNVNGTPAYGGPARLAALHLLLPVVGVPGQGTRATPPAPTPVSVLWPITSSSPKVVAAPYDEQIVLSDDRLAAELRPGGRLDALVSSALARRDDLVFGSLCFAIDPELVDTVEAMTSGYQVHTPSGTIPGKGRNDAKRWLASLRDLVAGHCVVQIPYADASLSTLTRLPGSEELTDDALTGASVLSVLKVQPRQGVVWPSGSLTQDALGAAARSGATTMITGPLQVRTSANDGANTGLGSAPFDISGTGLRALPYDSLVAAGLAGEGNAASANLTPADEPDVAAQNGIAAVAFRAGLDDQDTAAPVLVAPPRRWEISATELDTLLDSLTALRLSGLVQPTSLDDLLAGEAAGTAAPRDMTASSASSASLREPDQSVLDELADVQRTAADLEQAMAVDPTRQVQPAAVVQPLHNAVLRATSAAWRTDVGTAAAVAAPAREQTDALTHRVTVATPEQAVSLASDSSPLPVTLSNSLPVAITVKINLENIAGLRPADIPDTPLAAGSRVTRYIPADALRTGRFNINVALTTPGGTRLGTPAQLELTSTEFGLFTVVLTATAGGALVLLSGRRIYRRVRGDRTDRS
ncbi:hypothetical protein B0I33_105280 [Prauserella shujinwangii]|uniref:Glycoprotein n=1 Tax=Prauserella shujinwangii TaxID=1453103 RepID=A0A2T0LV24_9PSEU|nr:DUF6049 family protein [Prauserella shujinwangii]PRX47700.1 hypothetical protein B0I33_105280 [Prauserella shujinwangii]